MKRILLIILPLIFFLGIYKASASHMMGGEITWKCIKAGPNAGKFKFQVKYYRDCNGIPPDIDITLTTNAPGWGGGIFCPKVATNEISPQGLGCPSCANLNGTSSTAEEVIYESAYITIAGVPPATGWNFWFSTCCRNLNILNLTNPSSDGITLRAIMYPFNATNTNPCYDSSPSFAEKPQLSTCAGNQTSYSHNAIDEEVDSLVYDWGRPIENGYPGNNVAFQAPYTYTNPLPFTAPNVGATINANTGIICFFTSVGSGGVFVTVTKVTAYKCNIKVAEIFREIQLVIANNCIISGSGAGAVYNAPPIINFVPNTNVTTTNCGQQYIDTVYAGDTVTFGVVAHDFDPQRTVTLVGSTVLGSKTITGITSTLGLIVGALVSGNGIPAGAFITSLTANSITINSNATLTAGNVNLTFTGIPQSMSFDATGLEFGQFYTNPLAGCPITPCATLDRTMPQKNIGVAGGLNFNWVTSCDHLGGHIGGTCPRVTSVYNFVIKGYDNFCPSNAVNFNTITIIVKSPPAVNPPIMKCASVRVDGKVDLSWINPSDTGLQDTIKYFKAFYIWRSTLRNGPYTLVDSIFNLATLTYADINANGNIGPVYYYMTTRSGCDIQQSGSSDTIATMFLTVSQTLPFPVANLSWNPQFDRIDWATTDVLASQNFMKSNYRKYYIWKETPPRGSGAWSLVGTSTSPFYVDSVKVCDDTINYRIEVSDTTILHNCSSASNIAWARLRSTDPKLKGPSLRCASVLQPTGDVQLSWAGSADTASHFDKYYIYQSTSFAGPYTKIDSIKPYALNTYTDVGANANTVINYYYLSTRAGCDSATAFEDTVATSDTLATMIVNATPSLGFATLNWNPQRIPLMATSTGTYKIYRNVPPSAAWVLAGTCLTPPFKDTVVLCDTIIQYRVEISDASGCTSVSSIDNDRFTSLGAIVDNPQLSCLAVQANGNVQLTWVKPLDPNNFFAGYQIYHASSPAGPFTLSTTINAYNTTTYLDASVNANLAIQYYYLVTLSGCTKVATNGATGDTLATMLLTATPAFGFANLSWNAMHNPNLASITGLYRVMRRPTGVGAYTQIGTTALNVTTYQDVINQCNIPYEYRIELDDNLPCTSVSSADNDTFTSLGNVIASPTLSCVSVQANGQITLTWLNPTPSSFTDFNEYEIWRNNGTGWVLYDSVGTSGTTTYTDLTANGNSQSYSYYLNTQSGCTGQVNAPTVSNTLKSIYLTVNNATLGLAVLNWNAMCTPPLATAPGPYKIMRRPTGVGAYTQIGTAPVTGTTFSDTIKVCNVAYEYRVDLDNSAPACVSQSNAANGVFTYIGNVIASPSLSCVNVQANGQIVLTWLNPTPSSFTDFNEYEIWRNNGSGWALYDSVGTSGTTTYTDITANGNTQSYSYYLNTQSGCTGQVNAPTLSNTLSSIYLTVNNATLGLANLSWNAMCTPALATAPGPYKIMRRPTGVGAYTQIGTAPGLTFSDTIKVCNVPYEYRVDLDNSAPACVSQSNAANGVFTYIGNVIASPSLSCVNVQANGQIVLTWLNPTPSSFTDFNEYEIWRNNGSGWALYDSVGTSGTTTYTDVTANGNTQSYSYYLNTQSGCTGQVNAPTLSNTLSSIYLTVNNATLGLANLSWNAMCTPALATAPGPYKIMRRPTGVGAYTQIGTAPGLTFSDTIKVCNVPYEYRVDLDNSAPACVSQSNAANGVFTYIGNVIASPSLSCVNVQANGQIVLTWLNPTPSSFTDFNEYEIWRNNGSGWALYDSVGTSGTTTYTDIAANGNTQSYSYYLNTQSGCTGQVNAPTLSNTLSSIYLTVNNATLGLAVLNWNAMCTPALATAPGPYKIMRRPTGIGAYTQIGTATGITFSDTIKICNVPYEYRVDLDNSAPACVSQSNAANDVFTYIGNVIANPTLGCVNVQPNGQVVLTWATPTPTTFTNFNEYEIWRNDGSGWALYDSVSNSALVNYTDAFANADLQSYSYYVTTQSGCTGQVNAPITSDSLSSMYLTVNNATLGSAILNWNNMHAIPYAPISGLYKIYRRTPVTGSYAQIGTSATNSYTDPINTCNIPYEYRVDVDNSVVGCTSSSNPADSTFTYIGNIIANPKLYCASVEDNGQVTLTFAQPAGTDFTNYNEYEVWRNDGSGWALFDSVQSLGAVTYLDKFANANTQSYGYYMITQSGCTGQVDNGSTSDTLKTIYLTVAPTLGNANLNWTPLQTPLSASNSEYNIYSTYNNTGLLQWYGDTTVLNYKQGIINCDTAITYQITVNHISGCYSNSNKADSTFTYIGNVIDNPELRCVNVNSNGTIQLTWQNPTPSSWVNFNQYNLYSNTGSGFVLRDSIDPYSTNTYLDLAANGNASSVGYYLVTKSGCTGQVDTSSVRTTLNSIFLKVTGAGNNIATLNWNALRNPNLATAAPGYKVEREMPGGSGNWSILNPSFVGTSYTQTLDSICIDSVNYRVSMSDALGCNSNSNVDGEIFVDNSIPDAPILHCASVLVNGDIYLTWSPPADTAHQFNSYQIYASTNINGPYNLVDSIFNYNTINATISGLNAQANPVFINIKTRSGCGVQYSPASDTLKTIKVKVLNNNGVAVVTWNPLTPYVPGSNTSYDIYKEYPLGNWTKIDNVLAPIYQYLDTINVCQAVINYRVETTDITGCVSSSSIDGDLFRDLTKPYAALLDTVSLNPASPSNISISWLPSTSGDAEGYIIYHFNGASWDSIGSVNGRNNLNFADINPAAANGPQLYSIATFDSCRNVSNIGTAHNTMFTTAKLDICRAAIDVRWNPYINMIGGVGNYNVFMSDNGSAFSLLATVPSNNISYSHTTLVKGHTYCYYIQAQGNLASRTATSTSACEYANLLTEPTFSYLKKATVLDVRKVLVECLVDTANDPDVSRYKLQRSTDKLGPFITVGVSAFTGQPIVSFTDYTARTEQFSYFYRVLTIDSCGNEVLISNVGRTILLSGRGEFNLTNRLFWNDYEEWLGSVKNYSIYRKVDDVWEPIPINNNLGFGFTEFIDDVSGLYQKSGRFCYRIEAYENTGNPYGYADTSVSNEFCLIQEPHLFMPNAFTPNGKNPVLLPQHVFIDINKFFFVVYNRWGQKVFESSDPKIGWDGTYNGDSAPAGTYVYNVRIYGTNGLEVEKNGSVTLLR